MGFSFKATDSHGVDSNMAAVTVTVTGTNDAPVASNLNAGRSEDGGLGQFTVNTAISDVDAGDVLTLIAVDTSVTIGLVVGFGNNQITYTPNGQFEHLRRGKRRRTSSAIRSGTLPAQLPARSRS